jgi:protein-L-isoaspartate O-methyltransferase
MSGYSTTPLAQKLGVKEGSTVLLVGAPDGYAALLEPLPEGVQFGNRCSAATDIIHVFTVRRQELRTLLVRYRKRLKPNGIIWVSWPKKSAKMATEVTEDTIREVALPLGFVDIKVCAVDETWSGLKLVLRKELR